MNFKNFLTEGLKMFTVVLTWRKNQKYTYEIKNAKDEFEAKTKAFNSLFQDLGRVKRTAISDYFKKNPQNVKIEEVK